MKCLSRTTLLLYFVIFGMGSVGALALEAQSQPQAEETKIPSEPSPASGEVQERAVPGLKLPGQVPRVPAPPPPAPQTAVPLAVPSILPLKGATPGCPPPAVAGLGVGIDAANELLACPWVGLSRQRVQDSERNIRDSLEGKRLAHGGANLSLKGNSLAQWDFSLKMTNVGAHLDFAAPPGFRSASPNGFTLEAPLGRSWEIALRGQIEGRAKVEAGGQKVLSWSPSLFPFGIRISNIQTRADVKVDPSDPERPRLVGVTINPRFSVGGEGFIPLSIPMSFQTEVSGGKLRMVGHFTNLPVSLSPLDARMTGDFIMTFEPVRYDLSAQADYSATFLGTPRGVDIDSNMPPQQLADDLSDNLSDVLTPQMISGTAAFHAAFQLVTLTVQGELSIGLGFSYLGTNYDKRVSAPFGLSLPFVVPTTDELSKLIVGLQPGMPKTPPHGDGHPGGITPPLTTPVDFASPAAAIERGIVPHLPFGAVLSLDYPWLNLTPPIVSRLSVPLKTNLPTFGQDEDSAIWTGHYLAAESFRYAAMPSAEALDRVKLVLGGIKRLFDVTTDAVGPPVRVGNAGDINISGAAFIPVTAGPGILARTARRSDHPSNYTTDPGFPKEKTGPLETRPCHYLHPEGGWRVQGQPNLYPTYGSVPENIRTQMPGLIKPEGPIWFGWGCGTNHPVSRDQLVGTFMGLGMAYQNVNDPEVRGIAKKLVEDALDFLLRNNWNVVLPPDNRIVPSSSFIGDFPKQLAFLRIGKTVNQAKYGPLYDRYAAAVELSWITVWFSSFDPLSQYYKFNLSHAAFAPLLFLETNPSIRASAMAGYRVLWGPIRHHKNAYFDSLHILLQAPTERTLMANSPAPTNTQISLAEEIRSLLADWLVRLSSVKGPNGLPRDDIADWKSQSLLWPRDVILYTPFAGGKPHWIAQYALPPSKRIGRGMDFMWQREPFQVGMSESLRRAGALPPDQTEVLNSGAGGLSRLREGPAVDYLLAYYLAVYLGVISK
jgi:hypothetical protein